MTTSVILPAAVPAFLMQPRVAVLVTLRADGTPASTACWYEPVDSALLITMYTTAHRLPNIRRAPHVAVTIPRRGPVPARVDIEAGHRGVGRRP